MYIFFFIFYINSKNEEEIIEEEKNEENEDEEKNEENEDEEKNEENEDKEYNKVLIEFNKKYRKKKQIIIKINFLKIYLYIILVLSFFLKIYLFFKKSLSSYLLKFEKLYEEKVKKDLFLKNFFDNKYDYQKKKDNFIKKIEILEDIIKDEKKSINIKNQLRYIYKNISLRLKIQRCINFKKSNEYKLYILNIFLSQKFIEKKLKKIEEKEYKNIEQELIKKNFKYDNNDINDRKHFFFSFPFSEMENFVKIFYKN